MMRTKKRMRRMMRVALMSIKSKLGYITYIYQDIASIM